MNTKLWTFLHFLMLVQCRILKNKTYFQLIVVITKTTNDNNFLKIQIINLAMKILYNVLNNIQTKKFYEINKTEILATSGKAVN